MTRFNSFNDGPSYASRKLLARWQVAREASRRPPEDVSALHLRIVEAMRKDLGDALRRVLDD